MGWQSSMVELQEASPRLGRVMGVGQEPEEEARTELKPNLAKPQTDLVAAGPPWPVASKASPPTFLPFSSTICAFLSHTNILLSATSLILIVGPILLLVAATKYALL